MCLFTTATRGSTDAPRPGHSTAHCRPSAVLAQLIAAKVVEVDYAAARPATHCSYARSVWSHGRNNPMMSHAIAAVTGNVIALQLTYFAAGFSPR